MIAEVRIPIVTDADIVAARQQGRAIALQLGFGATDATLVATAISEVARNIVVHAGRGEVTLSSRQKGRQNGLLIVATDQGPGIRDVALAMQDGYSSAKSLGLGLPGARRLVDEFALESELGKGTTVTMTKWGP